GSIVSEHANGPRIQSISLPAPLILDDVVRTDCATELFAKIARDHLTKSGDTLTQRLLSNVQHLSQVPGGNGSVILPGSQRSQIPGVGFDQHRHQVVVLGVGNRFDAQGSLLRIEVDADRVRGSVRDRDQRAGAVKSALDLVLEVIALSKRL